MEIFFGMCISGAWIGIVLLLFIWAADGAEDIGWSAGVPRFAAVIVFIAATVAIAVAATGKDPHANQLCLAGYERWVTVANAKVGSHQEKRWFCTQWEPTTDPEAR